MSNLHKVETEESDSNQNQTPNEIRQKSKNEEALSSKKPKHSTPV